MLGLRVSPFLILIVTMSTAWMANEFASVSDTTRYRNRWLSDEKWFSLVAAQIFKNGNEDQANDCKFNRTNFVRAIGRKWTNTLEDFMESNETGIFRHVAKPERRKEKKRKEREREKENIRQMNYYLVLCHQARRQMPFQATQGPNLCTGRFER